MTVGDALLATNISTRHLYGKPGHGMTIIVNGKDLIIPGEHGTPSTIYLNGNVASTKDLLTNGDSIELILGKDGQDATATTSDLFEDAAVISVTVNGQQILLEPIIYINDKKRRLDEPIKDRDKIDFSQENTLATAISKMIDYDLYIDNKFIVYVNKKPVVLKNHSYQFLLNNILIKPTHHLTDGDEITIRKPNLPTINAVIQLAGEMAIDKINVTFNGEETVIEKVRHTFKLNGDPADKMTFVKANDHVELIAVNKGPIVFSDIFAFTNYNLPSDTTGTYQLLRNEKAIGFNDPIFGGDRLEISFINN